MYHFWVMLVVAGVLFIAQLVRDFVADLYYLFTGALLLDHKGESSDGN